MIGPLLRVIVVALVLLVGAMFLLPRGERQLQQPVAATILTAPSTLPSVSLIDKTGAEFTTDDLRGHYSLLFFGFTNCPDICPLTLSVLSAVHDDWAYDHVTPPEVLFVSVDPERDDAERISEYLANFDPDFRGVSGGGGALDPWLEALGVTVHVQKVPGQPSYNVTHNSTVFVVGPNAELIAVFSAPHDAAVIAADFLKIRQHHLSGRSAQSDSPARS